MNIATLNPDDGYGPLISTFLAGELPGANRNKPGDMLEAIYAELVGTKQVRRGPTPDPERAVALREVIREAQKAGKAIPILIPWGGFKTSGQGIDVADLFALRQLRSLDERITPFHEEGIHPVLRLEAYTEATLYSNRNREASLTYMRQLRKLVQIVYPKLTIVDELAIREGEFRHASEVNAKEIGFAIRDLPEADREQFLKHAIGWQGPLTDEMITYYMRVNKTFTQGETDDETIGRVARYFGRSLARYQFGVTGGNNFTGPFATLSLTQAPFGRTGRRIYYRTLPERYGHTHFAPWIGRGYLRVNGNSVAPALRSATETEPWLHPHRLLIDDGQGCEVEINGDYHVEA